jgi:DNA-binding CsgD family transcriptional regulator
MRGRDRELEVALGMLRAAEAGRGGILLVEGEPGIGKSRFLEESAAAATARGFTLAWGQGDARRMPGTRVLVPTPEEVLTPAGGAGSAGWWWDVPSTGPGGGLARHPAENPLQTAAADSPLRTADSQMLVVLDDLECADRAMLWGLRGLARHPRSRPPLWLLARSTASAYSDAQWLFTHLEDGGAARLRLGPLSETAVADVVAGVLDAAPDEAILALAAGTGGNPLLLTELLAGLRDEGKIQADAGSARLKSGQLPKRFLAVVQRWTTALGPRVRQVLAVGAVLGRSFSIDNVAALLGETPARLLPDVEAALRADLLVATPESFTFDRELVWRALAESVPRPARQALHRQIGQLLLDQGGPVTEAADHLASAGRPAAPAALARLDCAARALLASAPQTAADLALQALLLSEQADQGWFPRIVTAVEALAVAGRLAEAGECAQSALAGPVPTPRPVEMRLRSLLSSIQLCGGQPAGARVLAEELLGEPALSSEARDEAEITLMLALSMSVKSLPAESLPAESPPVESPPAEESEGPPQRAGALLAGAGQAGQPRLAAALLVRAMHAWQAGQLAPALDIAREAARMASTATTLTCRGIAPLLLGGMLVSAGQLDQADEVIRGLQTAAAATAPGGRDPSTEILAAGLALAAGRPAEAMGGAQQGLTLAATRESELLSAYGLTILATSALRGGDLSAAVQYVRSFQDRMTGHGPGYGQTRCLVVAAQLAEARQDADRAAELAGRLQSCLRHHPSVLAGDLTASGWMVRFALARGNPEDAEAVCAAAAELAAGSPDLAGVAAAAAHARGQLDQDAGALLRAAEDSPDPWARASAAEDLGVLLIGREDFEEAGRRLEDSLAGYDQTAALRDGRRVRRRLRGIGIRRRHFTHAKRPKTGWMSLTDTERAVSDLVAKGLTNQQIATEMFLSTHTVAFHLRQVFRKLDISSRVDLARVFTEQAQLARPGTGPSANGRPPKGQAW